MPACGDPEAHATVVVGWVQRSLARACQDQVAARAPLPLVDCVAAAAEVGVMEAAAGLMGVVAGVVVAVMVAVTAPGVDAAARPLQATAAQAGLACAGWGLAVAMATTAAPCARHWRQAALAHRAGCRHCCCHCALVQSLCHQVRVAVMRWAGWALLSPAGLQTGRTGYRQEMWTCLAQSQMGC